MEHEVGGDHSEEEGSSSGSSDDSEEEEDSESEEELSPFDKVKRRIEVSQIIYLSCMLDLL